MALWLEWLSCVEDLRQACTRKRTFYWLCIVLIGFSIRRELAGVTSFIRALRLQSFCYYNMLHLFHTPALNLKTLTRLWVKLAMRLFTPLQVAGRPVFVADGIKVSKEGLKMPSVKKLHQESANNSKPAYIFGHSFQAIGLLARGPLGQVLAVPLISRIHEGLVFSNRDKRTLLDKLVQIFMEVIDTCNSTAVLVADAYYASRKVILPLLDAGLHLVTRVKSNAVAYYPAKLPEGKRKRGAPKKYGDKLQLKSVWSWTESFCRAPSPVYGESRLCLRYFSLDLLWRPVGILVRFVWVDHPVRGRVIFMSTDLTMTPLEIIALYGYRFKIELAFKQALHTLGTYAYHFWMKIMTPRNSKSGNTYLHRTSDKYRSAIRRKMSAYHRYVQLGCIAQGLLQHLAFNFRKDVWSRFRSWLRTMKPAASPSEAVVSEALRGTWPEFLAATTRKPGLMEFITRWLDPAQVPDCLASSG